jgi:FlaA1/EpsC-like NDP-sugar epimerase
MKSEVRPIEIEDLLEREEININLDEVINELKGKTVLVTGAAGSIGSELCRQVATMGIQRLVLFDIAETPMYHIRMELEEKFPYLKLIPVIGDVRVAERVNKVFEQYAPQVVFHAAAYKHVPLMEENPCEAVLVNVKGSINVAEASLKCRVEKMIMISTDKAVNPTNIMGASKRLAEIYIQSLGMHISKGNMAGHTRYITTRFGNVLGSNGSVVPRFREQIEKGGPVTVTHPEITRFFMTIPEACRLVLEAATIGNDSEIFVFDMGTPIKIRELARRMIELAGYQPDTEIKIQYTGLRPGEKLYEELLSDEENTLPTQHPKIRVAQARTYEFEQFSQAVEPLIKASRQVDIPAVVKAVRRLVPEYKAQNSWLEKV